MNWRKHIAAKGNQALKNDKSVDFAGVVMFFLSGVCWFIHVFFRVDFNCCTHLPKWNLQNAPLQVDSKSPLGGDTLHLHVCFHHLTCCLLKLMSVWSYCTIGWIETTMNSHQLVGFLPWVKFAFQHSDLIRWRPSKTPKRYFGKKTRQFVLWLKGF